MISKKKILIVRFSSIGDIVLTTPVVRCLKNQIKDVEVHYVTKRIYKSVLEANPYIDKLHVMDKELVDVVDTLKNENFDFIVDLHRNIRSRLLIFKLRKKSATFNKLNIRKLIYVNFHINLLPNIHIVDRYFNAVKKLGVINDNEGLNFFINPDKEISKNQLPLTHQNGYIGFVIGSKQNTKKFPIHKIIEVCKIVDKPFILLGGKEDFVDADKIYKAVGNKIFNACGKYDIPSSASLVKFADKIITNDTGLMHIAAAFNKPILSLWGNTVPAFGMYPYLIDNSKSKVMEINGLTCRPCSKLGFKECPKSHFKCMELISVDEIVEWCNEN